MPLIPIIIPGENPEQSDAKLRYDKQKRPFATFNTSMRVMGWVLLIGGSIFTGLGIYNVVHWSALGIMDQVQGYSLISGIFLIGVVFGAWCLRWKCYIEEGCLLCRGLFRTRRHDITELRHCNSQGLFIMKGTSHYTFNTNGKKARVMHYNTHGCHSLMKHVFLTQPVDPFS